MTNESNQSEATQRGEKKEEAILSPNSRSKTKNTGVPQIWEQLLGYLNNDTPNRHPMSLNRLELLQFITQRSEESDIFYSRVGTILLRSIATTAVLVYEQTGSSKSLIFSSGDVKKSQQLMGSFPATNTKRPLVSLRLKKSQAWSRNTALEYATLATLKCEFGCDHGRVVVIAVSGVEPLETADLRFLDLIIILLSFKSDFADLGSKLNTQIKQYSTLIHHLNEGLVTLDGNLVIKSWNRPLQRLTGFSPKEAEDKSYYGIIQKVGDPLWLEKLMKIAQSGSGSKVFKDDFEIRTKSKKLCWVGVSGSFLLNERGDIEQVLIIVRDISHVKELENRKNEFISIATHELRTPITAIKGYLDMLGKDSEGLSEKQTLYLTRATQANERLVSLAEDLLQIIQTEENRLIFVLKPIDITPIITKAISDLSHKAQKRNVTLSFIGADFRPIVAVDAIRFEQVVSNLIDNSIKYTNKGGVTISFVKNYNKNEKDQNLLIQIKDTGIGMTESEASHIFDKFHRTESARLGRESGAGLGLFIVKSFIEKQNGKISVKSRVNHGSIFTISLPLVEYNNNQEKTNE